ncbi:putative bifunctional diguanylate cyclase/phosphodiesterase [Marinicauda sp. Alg238-R41]|uniref:putative bifunctional diguanylate cyclase/phosphodiesterase n=1 Tax=Marinicauda sp. Alg238-R41 TaxID=2993447 RepID=UPI0022E779D6|nr:EAL domain-containing protein [Marinicauda sp. Alg238-R41]
MMRSLVAKFTVLCGIILIAAISMLVVIQYQSTVRDNHRSSQVHASLITELFANGISGQLGADNRAGLNGRLREFAGREDVASVYVVDAMREVIGAAGPGVPALGVRASENLLQSAIGAVDSRMMIADGTIQVAAPIFADGRLAGATHVTVPIAAVARPAGELLLRQAIIGLGSMLIFLPLVALAVRQALGPIKTLTEAARLASSRKLDLRIDVHTGDELEVLANSFNRMFGRLEASVKRIQRLAYVDMVTELPNRERFRKELERVCAQAQDDDADGGAVLFLDLDRFKRVNDSLGIGEGDRLLEAVARRLREAARAWDLSNGEGREPSMVARLGGDEFTLLLPTLSDPADAARVAHRVVDAIRRPFEISGHQVFLGLSVGVALFPRDGSDPETLLRHADLAMATAKRSGGNAYEFFESKMNQSAFERLVLENELREAVREEQLVVYYQPKVFMTDGRFAGCEALVRWQHPTAGLLSPGAFIQAAEECGLIGEIGDYVLRRTCTQFAELYRQGMAYPVAVNVSAMQFESEGFADTVLDALNSSGLPPHLLELELTESTAMRDPERVIHQIEPLRQLGVTFAIDDFGTGHSSLSYLTRMPFDVFKIDQSFVRHMESDPHAKIVVETILAMAKSLKLKTVAEGVETTEQLAFLRGQGATLAQGYLFGRPMPLPDLVRFAEPENAAAARIAQ